jgi:energy-coupling factor transporter ATP-binding protein EcfA2
MAEKSSIEIYVEGVRSFVKPRWIPLARLTLLVGENSSGKSTFLAIAAAVLDRRFPAAPQFNAAPYSLGNFDTIASNQGKGHKAKTFAIGFKTDEPPFTGASELTARYTNQAGESELSRVDARTDGGSLSADVDNGIANVEIPTVRKDRSDRRTEVERHVAKFDPVQARRSFPPLSLGQSFRRPRAVTSLDDWQEDFDRASAIDDVVLHAFPPFPQPFSFAPIRSKPRRTYDELSEVASPEGDHIPTVISRLLARSRETETVRRLRRSLVKFGTDSGLFTRLSVKRLGKSLADPFRIEVASSGHKANLIDVGYGVSQSLPVIVECILSHPHAVMFLQQPEVHLHPKAQAALGTFFVDLIAGTSRTLAVETHSDYLVDRVRQEVAKGRISADEVLILFFNKPKLETTVYPIHLDENGNVLDPPPSYREFFLHEELNLLNRANS